MAPQLLISFKYLHDQPITFWAMSIPRENTPDWVKVRLGKRPYAWEQNRAILWSLVYLKCSKLEVCNPQVMTLDIFAIIYKSNDPQIFHLQKKLWLYKLFMRLGACFGFILIVHAWRAPSLNKPTFILGKNCFHRLPFPSYKKIQTSRIYHSHFEDKQVRGGKQQNLLKGQYCHNQSRLDSAWNIIIMQQLDRYLYISATVIRSYLLGVLFSINEFI